jgi:1,4-alpha-glucan branching enzyme
LPPTAFIDFLQNHDQIGNRALGERIEALADSRALAAALAVTLLAPMPPMMFMGEEWGSTRAFPFFCDFKGGLADAVRKGRRKEFESAYARFGDDIPDPFAEQTFRSAVLDWDERWTEAGRKRLGLVRDLLAVRRAKVVPLLADIAFDARSTRCDGDLLMAGWTSGQGRLRLLANLSDEAAKRPNDWTPGEPIWGGAPSDVLPPWSVFWSLGTA